MITDSELASLIADGLSPDVQPHGFAALYPALLRELAKGITLRKTPHIFAVDGRTLYTWCAVDALMFPAVIGKTARVQSRCLETGAFISLTSTPYEIRDMSPSAASVSLVIPNRRIRTSFCCHVHFFVSDEAGRRHVAGQEGVKVVSVATAFAIGQKVAEKLRSAELMS